MARKKEFAEKLTLDQIRRFATVIRNFEKTIEQAAAFAEKQGVDHLATFNVDSYHRAAKDLGRFCQAIEESKRNLQLGQPFEPGQGRTDPKPDKDEIAKDTTKAIETVGKTTSRKRKPKE